MPSSSRSRVSGRGADGAPRNQMLTPMSERQQLALVMQMSSQDATPDSTHPPIEERKRSRQQRNERGETPLHVAAIRGDHELVRKHMEHGQDPDVPDFAGWTPLHEACSYGWYQVVEVLVNGGADVNVKGLDDDTPLHDATTSGNLQMVKFLVQHGADPFAKNSKGKIPKDYAAPHIFEYLNSIRDSSARASHSSRARDEGNKKSSHASGHGESSKRRNMETVTQSDQSVNKETPSHSKESRDESLQLSSGVVSSTQDDPVSITNVTRHYTEDSHDVDTVEDEVSKRKKRKEHEEREPMCKPPPPPPLATNRGGQSRFMTGSKPPGPASKTGGGSAGKGGGKSGSGGGSGKSAQQSQGKGSGSGKSSSSSHQGKSSGGSKSGSGSQGGKQERASPKPQSRSADHGDADHGDDHRALDSSGLKVPPLKIVIPGGGSAGRSDQDDGPRGSGKGRGGASTLPYVLPCSSADLGQTSDSSDGAGEGSKAGHRVLRSHRTNEGDRERERASPHSGSGHFHSSKSPSVSASSHDEHAVSSSSRAEPDVHPRKRKLKSRGESSRADTRGADGSEPGGSGTSGGFAQIVAQNNPYLMHLSIRKQIEQRQKSLFPVKPKPPKDFNNYLMNRKTYTLQNNGNREPPRVELPHNLPPQMVDEYIDQERERHRLRVQHLVEKEKLVLAVEQEILRVHGRAERAVANQALPYSACTILRDKEVYSLQAPEQEDKRNAQRSRCNGRQINSWLQEVDDKWEKIKEGVLRRQNTEAQSLHAVQCLAWDWRLRELGLAVADKPGPSLALTPTLNVDLLHVPLVHVSNFDLPA